MSASVEVGQRAGVVFVTLRHPGKLNAMSRAMWRALRSVFESIQFSTEVRCVLVRGKGGDFCAGGDIAEYPGFRFDEASLRDFHENDVWCGLQAMLDCDVPMVAQIEGNCLGAGVEIACCCDIRIAAESARFGAPIARLGFPMAPREAGLVLREAGAMSTREMLLQAARLNKQTLRALNHAPALVPYARSATDPIANAFRYANSAEHREGIAAFMQKRKPMF